jgi:hypothetical protein
MKSDAIQEAITSSVDINAHIITYAGMVAGELLEIDKESGSMLSISNGLLAFSFLDWKANVRAPMAYCHMLPFGNEHLPPSAQLPSLAAETIKKRPLSVIKHVNNLTERPPQGCCFVNLIDTLDGRGGKDFDVTKERLEREWNSDEKRLLDDEKRNAYDVMYFHSERVIAFPMHVAGAPIIICYVDDKNDQVRLHGQKHITEYLFGKVAPLASQSLFTYLHTRLFNIAEDCLRLVEQESLSDEDSLLVEFLTRVSSLLCARSFEYLSDSASSGFAESTILHRFPEGSRIGITLPKEMGRATISLSSFKVGEKELCSEGFLSKLQKKQLEELLGGLVNLLHNAAELKEKSLVIGSLARYTDELSQVRYLVDSIQHNLAPGQREGNRRWLEKKLLSIADGDDWGVIGAYEQRRLNEFCPDDERWVRYAQQLRAPNLPVEEVVETLGVRMADNMHHVFEDMARVVREIDKESDKRRKNLEILSWCLLSTLVTKESRGDISYERMAACEALCYTWFRYPDGANNREEWFQLGRLCKTAKSEVKSESQVRNLLNIDPNRPLKLQMLSAKHHVVDLDLRCDFTQEVPGPAIILLFGGLRLIPSRNQLAMKVCLSSEGDFLINRISFDKERGDSSRRDDSPLPNTLPITRLSKMVEVIRKFYETEFVPGNELTFRLKVK